MRPCPICKSTNEDAVIFQEENIDPKLLSEFSFASRKAPEFMCHLLLKCKNCDLVYASTPPAKAELAHSYHVAQYDSSEEANDAAASYIDAMRPLLNKLENKARVLEIGAGTGILLEYLRREGFKEFVGVEPSTAAIAAAPKERQEWLEERIFEEKNYKPCSFQLICCFMTMEHVYDPEEVARAAYNLLTPGGVFVTVTHDYRSTVNKLLGKRSPIIDIEHMQLFSRKSISRLFQNIGFVDIENNAFKNKYSLRYWLRLAPLPESIKVVFLSAINKLGLAESKIAINVGNMITYGTKN